ncbi:MAG: cyclophilin-like family protein [Hyphomicrobiaceae bacterium]
MPTNIIRKANKVAAGKPAGQRALARKRAIAINVGGIPLVAHLLPSETAARVHSALPLYGIAETWGQAVHFELPMALGRERGARINGILGDVYVWAEEQRIILPFGPTPISGKNEIRLPRPCNVLARIEGDLSKDIEALKEIQPGTKISIMRHG